MKFQIKSKVIIIPKDRCFLSRKELYQVEDNSENIMVPLDEPVSLTFHGDLVDFIKKDLREGRISVPFNKGTTVKHAIEALGIPHPEVDRIECDGHRVPFNYAIQSGDEIHVYPFTTGSLIIDLAQIRFVLDNHLGKLTDYLRLLGFDAVYAQDWPDSRIAQYAADQKRILLTRDRGLLKRKIVSLGRCIRADDPINQLQEVIDFYGLKPVVSPFRRCPRCNGSLRSVPKEQIADQLLPLTNKYYDEFTRCVECGQIYWKGSHYENMLKILAPFLEMHPEEI